MNSRNINTKHSRAPENNLKATQTLNKISEWTHHGKGRRWWDSKRGCRSGSLKPHGFHRWQVPVRIPMNASLFLRACCQETCRSHDVPSRLKLLQWVESPFIHFLIADHVTCCSLIGVVVAGGLHVFEVWAWLMELRVIGSAVPDRWYTTQYIYMGARDSSHRLRIWWWWWY